MKSKKQVFIERRIFSRLKVPLSINFRLMSQWKNPRSSRIIKGRVWAVSRAGLCLETGIDMKEGVLKFSETEAEEKVRVLPYLVLSEKEIEVDLKLPPNRNEIIFTGKPLWYELASEESVSKLKMGMLFTDMPRKARDKWGRYIKHADSLLPLGNED
jgi:hypothetical protein